MIAPTYPERSNFAKIKEAVKLDDFAARYTDLHGSGETRRGVCPLCKKGGAQAFAVYPDGHWHCFHGCGSGDVIDLHSRLHNRESWESMVALAQEHGVELHEGRTEGWRQAQSRKYDVISKVERAIISKLQRRIFKVLCTPYLRAAPNEGPEHEKMLEEDGDELWHICGLIAREMRARRTSRHEKRDA